MARVEFTGRDLTEAINTAANALDLPPEQVKFAVISMGAKGFLGLGRRPAKISVDPDDPRLDLADGDGQEPARLQPQRSSPPPPEPPAAVPERSRAVSNYRPQGDPEAKKKGPAEGEKRPAGLDKSSRPSPEPPAPRGLNRPGMVREPSPPPRRKTETAAEALPLDWGHLPPPLTRPGPGETWQTPDQAAEMAAAVVGEIAERMGFTIQVTAGRLGSRLIISLDSVDNALLIRARGATLEAWQLLTAKILSRRLAAAGLEGESDRRVVLDVADYRFRRWTHLLDTLKSQAEQARQTHKPQAMTGLSPAERRLILAALSPFKDLAVQPGGGGHRDSLIVVPQAARRRHHKTGRAPHD